MVLMLFDQETVILIPDTIIMESKTELTQYFIKEWSLQFFNIGMYFRSVFANGNSFTHSPFKKSKTNLPYILFFV